MDDEQYLIERLNAKKQQLLDDYNFMSEQAFLAITKMSRAELEQLKEMHQVLFIESNDGVFLYPEFQLVAGRVSPILADSLPRLYKSRSGWDICFWLTQKFGVLLVDVDVPASRLEGLSLDAVLSLGAKADEQCEYFRDKPLDALQQQKEELFKTLIEAWFNPDYRVIPKKPLIQ